MKQVTLSARHVEALLGTYKTQGAAAEAIGMHVRTLRRLLKGESGRGWAVKAAISHAEELIRKTASLPTSRSLPPLPNQTAQPQDGAA